MAQFQTDDTINPGNDIVDLVDMCSNTFSDNTISLRYDLPYSGELRECHMGMCDPFDLSVDSFNDGFPPFEAMLDKGYFTGLKGYCEEKIRVETENLCCMARQFGCEKELREAIKKDNPHNLSEVLDKLIDQCMKADRLRQETTKENKRRLEESIAEIKNLP